MAKDPKIFIEHIIKSILAVHRYIGNLDKQGFLEDEKTQDSVIRRLETIGEAVKNLDYEFRDTYPDVPWKSLAAFRDVLIHQYYNVDVNKLWAVTQKDLNELESMVKVIHEKL